MTVVAIDGPAAAGKSTVARAVADALGFGYVDTGAMYRAVALAAIENGISPEDADEVGKLARGLDIVAVDGSVWMNGRDVTGRIRDPDVTEAASAVATHLEVRDALVPVQRRIAEGRDVVMEGRDIGTKVVPDAQVKVYLTATLEERAARRGRELGISDDVGVTEVARSIEARDRRDSTRSESPLIKPPGAIEIDTTGMSVDEVVATVADAVGRVGRFA